jgi:hypothetical protein
MRQEFSVLTFGQASESLTSTNGGVIVKRFNSIHGDGSSKGLKNGKYAYGLHSTSVHTVGYNEKGEVVEDRLIHLPMTEPKTGSAEDEKAAMLRASAIAVKCRADVPKSQFHYLPDDLAHQHVTDVQVVIADSCVTAKNVSALVIEEKRKHAEKKFGLEKLALMTEVERQDCMAGIAVDCVRHLGHLVGAGTYIGLDAFAAECIGNWGELSTIGDADEAVAGFKAIIWDLVSERNLI